MLFRVFCLCLLVVLSGCGAGFCVFGNIGTCPTSGAGVTATGNAVSLTSPFSTVGYNQTMQLTASGGTPPYTYAVTSGVGSVNSAGLFTSPTSGSGAITTVIRTNDTRYTGTGDPDTTHYHDLTITVQ